MRKLSLGICFILILSLLVGCGNTTTQNEDVGGDNVGIISSMELKYTSSFDVKFLEDGNKLITDGIGREILLVQRDAEIPEEYKDFPVIHIPVEKVVVTSETQGSMLEPSKAVGTIIGYTENINDWYLEELKENIETGKVEFLGGGESPDYEKIKELSPDVVLVDAGLQQIGDKLDALGIPYIIDSSDWEADPMARMEWIKLFACFYNMEDEVIAYFDRGVEKLKDIEERVKGLEQPKVSWGFLFTGKAFVPYAGSYVSKHIELAGGDYVFKDIGPDKTHTATITMEEFYTAGQVADVYISSGPPAYHTSTQDIVDRSIPIMADMKPIKEDAVWCYQPWYYQLVHETPEAIEELQAILYPELYPDYNDFRFYWKVPLAE
ncbi:MAG: ABC transporter substrate-binding protein [Clostridiales bacterium]|nr:ABC transporter substrate-binding protein [Clostridiales bacterium]